MKRFASCYQMAKKIVDSKEFGKPSVFELKMTIFKFFPGDPLGFLLDMDSHAFDLCRYFMGDVDSVYAVTIKNMNGQMPLP